VRPSRVTYASSGLLVLFFATAKGREPGAPQPQAVVVHQSPISGLPISVGLFTSDPADLELSPRSEGARRGHLWIRKGQTGLYIAGKVDGEQPDFPHSKDQILAKDHVEVWLAGASDFDLPEIGWGNQFGEETLPKGEESCPDWARAQANVPNDGAKAEEKCREWAATQALYRPYFKRLFARQWLLAPDLATESFATPAYEEIEKRFSYRGDDRSAGDKLPEFMKPAGKPQMFLFPEQSGYSFEILVPLEAFPPLSTLRPSELRLLVDVFKAAPPEKKMGVYSTSSPARAYGRPETFNSLRLDPPLYFRLSPCDLPLLGTDKREEYHPAWFLPSSRPDQNVSDTFIVRNDPAGYRYEPAGLSPTVRPTHYFWKEVGQDEWVCGPHLTYRKRGHSESFAYTVSEDGFDTKRLADGAVLIKTGPRVWYSEFGSGQCGACPWADLRIFELDKDMKPWGLLNLGDIIGGPPGLFSQDFTVSTDWSQITEYDLKGNEENLPGSWSSTTWCLTTNSRKDEPHAHAYEKCGQKENVQPPDPPVLKELRDVW